MWFSIYLTGPWRWFDESMLDCCEPLEKVKATGITFGKLVCLAHCAGAKVEAFRTSQSTIEEFRKHVMRCSVSDACHLISSYDRSALKQVTITSSFFVFWYSINYSLLSLCLSAYVSTGVR